MFAVARALADDMVAAGEYPVEMRIVMHDRLDRASDVAEEPPDLGLAVGQTPFGEIDLGVFGEQIEDRSARRGHAAVVEALQIFERDGFSVLVRHGFSGKRHIILHWRQRSSPRQGALRRAFALTIIDWRRLQ